MTKPPPRVALLWAKDYPLDMGKKGTTGKTDKASAQAPVLDYATPDSPAERPAWRWARAGLGLAALATWFVATMANASPHTLWERQPLAGPFFFLNWSASPGEYALFMFLLGCIVAPLAPWVWTGRVWGVVVAVVASAATVFMSWMVAAGVDC